MSTPQPPPAPLKLFYSYAHEDEDLRSELEKHLIMLRRDDIISEWHDRAISAGQEWDKKIKEHLDSADIILLLVSPDFLASDYCHDTEVKRAMERHASGEARVIPVILRPSDWASAPFGKLQALPKDAKPVTLWADDDEAFLSVARGIRAVAAEPPPRGAREADVPAACASACIPRPPVFGFVARRDEAGRDLVGRLREALAPGRNQLVTLSGPGGIGKSTLAAEVARGLYQAYAGRIVWSGADARADFSLQTLLDDIATQLGHADFRQLAPDPKAEQVRALVAAPPTLVVLDNYETVPPLIQKSVEKWFRNTPCSALFTSRPKVAETLPVQVSAMSREEAEEFLALLIGTTQIPSIFSEGVRRRIYETAEANPFVMQWVVAQIDAALEPDAALEELKQGEGDAAQRVFDRSFELPQLGDDGRAALLALSLFVPSASRVALAEVAGFGGDRKRLNEAVKNMHALWLIKPIDENRRLTFEGLTRSLTAARLSRDERATSFRQRFVAYFLAYAAAHGRRTVEDSDALAGEKDNLLSALDIAFGEHDWQSVVRIRSWLDEFLDVRGYWAEAINTGEQALQAARLSGNESLVADRAHALAVMYHKRGALGEAKRLYDQGLEIFRRLGPERHTVNSLHQLGRLKQDAGDDAGARLLFDESLKLALKFDERLSVAHILHELGRFAHKEGNIEEARRLYRESLKIKEDLNERRSAAHTLHQLGWLAHRAGDLAEARQFYEESLKIKDDFGDQHGIANALNHFGLLAAEVEGDEGKAAQLFDEALKIFQRLESPSAKIVRQNLAQLGHRLL